MSRLDHIKVGDTVRLHGDRFVQGHVEGKVTEAFRHDLYRVEGANWPSEAVLYETVTGLRALLGGSVYSLSDVEVVVSAPAPVTDEQVAAHVQEHVDMWDARKVAPIVRSLTTPTVIIFAPPSDDADPLEGMTPIADMHPITERGR